jgi:parvulin-like peptidyl-prolyl isomerase
MTRSLIVCLAAGACCFALGCGKTDTRAAARIGEMTITAGQIKDEYIAITPTARPDLKTIDEKESFAKDIVAKEILKMEARARGIDRLPEVTQMRTTTISRRAYQTFYEDEIRGKVSVPEEQLRDLYAKQKNSYHLAWILVRSVPLAGQIAARIRQGEDFGALAATYSIDGSRSAGGDIGMRLLGTLPAPVEAKILTMAPGEVSDAIPFDSYGVVVKMLEIQPGQTGSFEEARPNLEVIARANAEGVRQREIVAELKQRYDLALNAAAVDMIVAKTRALYSSPGTGVGAVPEFSDEEMDRDLASWKGGAWKVGDYVQNMAGLRDYMRPGPGADAEWVRSLVGDFVTGQLWGLEIKDKGFETRTEVVKAGDRAAEEVMITRVHDELVKDVKLQPGTSEKFYEENKAQLMTDPGVRIAIIVSADSAQSREIYDQLQAGAKFDVLAKEKSIDEATADDGGELMVPLYTQDIEQLPDLQEVVNNLSVGAYSTPMPVPAGLGPAGFMVVKVLEKFEARQMTLEEIKDDLSDRVLVLEQDKVFGEWLKSKMDEYKVEVYPDGLNSIDFEQLKAQGA